VTIYHDFSASAVFPANIGTLVVKDFGKRTREKTHVGRWIKDYSQ
jgi:hypothetical protein